MKRGLALFALASGFVLLGSAPSSAVLVPDLEADPVQPGPSAVLETATISAALLPPDPAVVTDEALATVGAAPAVLQPFDDPLLVVDDDLAQCPNADFTTAAGIQAAIDTAPPGAKIRVCPGSYSPIDVHKPELWLQAPRAHGNANGCREGDPAQDAIVAGSHPVALVQITASGVVLEGFVVQGNSSGPGVRTNVAGSGYELRFNEVRESRYGIDLNTDGLAATEVSHNCIRDNSGLSVGIQSSAGFANTRIEHNYSTGHACAALVSGLATPNCQLQVAVPNRNVAYSHNSLVDDAGVFFGASVSLVVSYNEALRALGAAVVLENVVGAEVSSNHIDGDGRDPTQGIAVREMNGVALDTVIKSNKVENLSAFIVIGPGNVLDGFGISVNGPGVAVLENWVQFNRGTGISLRARSVGNTVRGNLLVGNGIPGTDLFLRGSDGIRVQPGAVANVIENNRLGEPLNGNDPAERANRDHDCHDDNPSGSNVWRHNVGYTENRPDLCVRRTP